MQKIKIIFHPKITRHAHSKSLCAFKNPHLCYEKTSACIRNLLLRVQCVFSISLTEDWSRACSSMVVEWEELERAYTQGDHTVQARWLSGGPVRAAIGGVGGNRWLLMAPEPVSAELWRAVSGNLRNVKMTLLTEVDRIGDTQVSLAQRAKQPSAGGVMTIFSSKSGTRRHVTPLGTEDSMREQDVDRAVPDGNAGER